MRLSEYIAIHAVPSDWSMCTAVGNGWAVEHADVVHAEEAALEDVLPVGVLVVHPPGEIDHQLVEDPFEEDEVALSVVLAAGVAGRTTPGLAVDLKYTPARPGVDGRVDVAEVPFVGGQLAVGVGIPFAGEQQQLIFGESGSIRANGIM